MDIGKEDVRQMAGQLDLANHYQRLKAAYGVANSKKSAENLRRLRDRFKEAKAAWNSADAAKRAPEWNAATRQYFNTFVEPLWGLMHKCRELLHAQTDEERIDLPRELTPTPATRHRTPSLTVASSSTWTSAGAGIDKDHDNNDDNVHPNDSASNVSSTTSSARCRNNVNAERMKLEVF